MPICYKVARLHTAESTMPRSSHRVTKHSRIGLTQIPLNSTKYGEFLCWLDWLDGYIVCSSNRDLLGDNKK